MNKRTYILVFLLLLAGFTSELSAQKKPKKAKQEISVVSGQVVDSSGIPVAGALVTAMEGAYFARTDADGAFSVKSGAADYILIEAEGYEPKEVYLPDLAAGQAIALEASPYRSGSADRVELPFGTLTDRRVVGAVNDIEKITKIAKAMVRVFGMSSLGPIQYADPQGNVFLGRDYNNGNNYSAGVAAEIDKEVRKIVDECYEDCKRILSENRDLLDLIANSLFEEETLTKEQINNLVEYGTLTSPQEEAQRQAKEEAQAAEGNTVEEAQEENDPPQEEPKEPDVSDEEMEEALKELTKK